MKTVPWVAIMFTCVVNASLYASSLSTTASASWSGMLCTTLDSCSAFSLIDSHNGTGYASATVGSESGFAWAHASASFGSLSAFAVAGAALAGRNSCDGAFPCPLDPFPQTENNNPSAYASASFSDTIFTLGPPGTGMLSVDLAYGAAGETALSAMQMTVFEMGSCSGPWGCSSEFPLHGSIPLFGHVAAFGYANPDYGEGYFSVVDLSILSTHLTDLEGNPTPNPPYWSESGTRYFGPQNYVPEPGTGGLALLSLGAVAARLRLRGRPAPLLR